MANPTGFSPLRVKGPSEYLVVKGSFAPNGASALDATAVKGRGFSVARSGVGIFTVTFDAVGVDLVSTLASLRLNASANSMAQPGAYDATAKTLIIRTLTAGADADIAANANNRVSFEVTFNLSSVLK